QPSCRVERRQCGGGDAGVGGGRSCCESAQESGVVVNAGEITILNFALNRVSFSPFINNGDFECLLAEDIATGWKKWKASTSNPILYSMDYSDHLAGTSAQVFGRKDSSPFNGGIVTKVPTSAGVKYEVSAWVRMETSGSNTWLAFGVDTTGQMDNGVSHTINYKNFESKGNRKWHRYRQIITATSNSISIFAKYGKATGGSGSNYAYVDNVTVQPYTELEAEDYDQAYDTTSGNYGGEYRDGDVDIGQLPGENGYYVGWTAAGEWLQWNNVGSIGGDHLLVIDYSGVKNYSWESEPKVRLLVNGTNVTGDIELTRSGNYDAYRKYVHPTLINIPQGTNNTIRLTFQTSRSNIDKIALIPISKSIKIEAEDYQSYYDTTPQNEGGQYRNDGVDIGLNNAVYFVGWTAANEWLEYHLKGDSRTYAVFLRYAATSNASVDLVMNGYPVIENISLPSTGGWYTWQFKYAGIITANTGDNALRLFMKTGGFNLDNIVLVPIGDGNAGSDLLTGVHFAGDVNNGILDFVSERDLSQWIYTTEAFVNNDRDPDTNSEIINWMNTWINGQLKSLHQNRIKPIIRIDWKWGETVPRLLPNNQVDNVAVSRYARTFRKFAQLADAAGVPIRHFVVANEMNLKGEANGFANGYIPEWYYAYVYDVVKNEMAQLGAGYEVMVGAVSPGSNTVDNLQSGTSYFDPNVLSVDGLVYLENVIKELKRKGTPNPDFSLHAYADFDNRFNYTINFYWVLRKQLEIIMKTHTIVPYGETESVTIPGYANAGVYITEWNRHTPVNSSEGRVEQERRTSAFIRTAIDRINKYNVNREIFDNQNNTYRSYDHRNVAHNFLPIKGMCYFVFNDDPLWNDYSLKYWNTLSGSATGDDDMYNTHKSFIGRRYPAGR
ncbi:MAG: carbohydrate-binding domain-containing protein, partial [Armatimonadota bacterium]